MHPEAKPTPAQQLAQDLRDFGALQDLAAHPAWAVLVRQSERAMGDLAKTVLSPQTSPQQAELARQLYIGLEQQFSPVATLRDSMKRLGAIYDRHAAEVAKNCPPSS